MRTTSETLNLESLVRRLSLETILAVSLVIILALSLLSYLSLRTFETQLAPEFERKAETVGEQVADAVVRAVDLGIPFPALVGMDALLAQVLANQPEIGFLRVVDMHGEPIFYRDQATPDVPPTNIGSPPRFAIPQPAPGGAVHLDDEQYRVMVMPLQSESHRFGYLLVGTDKGYVREQQLEIIYDILTTLMISMLVTFEILFVMIALNLLDPLKQAVKMLVEGQQGNFFFHSKEEGYFRDELSSLIHSLNRVNQRISEGYRRVLEGTRSNQLSLATLATEHSSGDPGEGRQQLLERSRNPTTISRAGLSNLRLPLFVFFFGSELSRSFLPLFAQSLYEPGIGISKDFAVALPFSIYLLFFMVATPFSGTLVPRIGPRRLFLLGLVPSLLGFGLTSITDNLLELVAFRALNGIGYAMVSIAAIGYIVKITGTRNRAQGMVIFFNASMIAGVSGSAIGGILADRLGYGLTFVLSALLTVLSAVMIFRLLPGPSPSPVATSGSGLKLHHLFTLLRNQRFVYLTLLCAMPTQIILTGFFFYAIPQYLSFLGNTTSVIGRVMMIYFLVVILVGPQVARYTDSRGLHHRAVSIGVIVAGIGMLMVGYWENTLALALAILGLALGNAMILSNQPSVLLTVTPEECKILGQTTVLSIFRLLERAGGALGPFIFAFLIARGGYQWATAIGGGFALVCGSAFLLSMLTKPQSLSQAEESTP